ncbi:MAG: oligoendopeptidase F [Clostridiales Family XIII bacterium]|nr:oligoendopeptidase F [Clostridiales Family XIII bacterium]
MAKHRAEIENKYKWAIEDMYPKEEQWEADCQKALGLAEGFASFAGKLSKDGASLFAALKARDELWRLTEHIYVYARMRRDENNTDARYQAMADRAQTLMAKAAAGTAFFIPEITQLGEKKVETLRAEEPGIEAYDFVLRTIFREKPHVLPPGEEALLARLGEVLGATGDIFTMINDADMKFGETLGEDGQPTELTHGNYIKFMESKNREVRKTAYETLYAAFSRQRNTLAATYSYNTKTDVIASKIRAYPSSLAAALAGDNVREDVYTNLIGRVGDSLPVLHRYLEVRRRLLEVPKLEMYDIYVPLVARGEQEVSFADAAAMMHTALAPLGTEYTQQANSAFTDGWIDVYENEGKSSGAYSFGSYDSKPYILMNYAGKLKDVFTLVHEMGHSMHSFYTRRRQPFTYGSHSIFTAEVASTVNENLLVRYLLDHSADEKERAYFLNFYIEEFRTTLFRQTMFAEFEKMTHEAVENGEALTCELLSERYGGLNEKYFGPAVHTDELIRMEWSRIPHFYRAFYVYKYATGFSAAAAIANRILTGGQSAVEDYIRFLESGDSDDPIELLKIAGVDMSKPEPVEAAMRTFEKLVSEFDDITK